jgi:Uma2 family endonuclease
MSPHTLALPNNPMSAEEFAVKYERGYSELIGGIPHIGREPSGRRGQLCAEFVLRIGNCVEEQRLGHVMCNNVHILTKRNPDSVRAPEICYFSFERLPPGPAPKEFTELVPDLVVEMRLPTQPIWDYIRKSWEYLDAGVKVVLVCDVASSMIGVFRNEEWPQRFHIGDVLALPDVLPGFAVPVKQFFE